MRRIISISFASFISVLCSPAVATCPPYRHTLNNGTTADAAQVMDNFNDVLNCMAPLANPVFTGKVAVGTTNVAALLTLFDPTTSLIRQGTQNYTYEVGPAADNGVFHIRRNDGLFADRLVIDVAGHVGIGTAVAPDLLSLFDATAATIRQGTPNYTYEVGPVADNGVFHIRRNDGVFADRLTIDTSGNLAIGTLAGTGSRSVVADSNGTFSAASDERLKKIVGPYSDGLSAVLTLRPILYTWKSTSGLYVDRPVIGFSAQNVQRAIPAAVGTGSNGYLTLDDRGVLAASVNAIKEIKALSDKQSSEIDRLTKENATLKAAAREQSEAVRELRGQMIALERKSRTRTARN